MIKILFAIFTLFFVLVNNGYSRTGVELENIANEYLNHNWNCNVRNARRFINTNNRFDNTDTISRNNDNNHPFYPQGAKYRNAQNQEVISTGQYTGVAYAWGNRETPGEFDTKLASQTPNREYLASSMKAEGVHPDLYAGLDCSGFVAMCHGLPLRNGEISENRWHPGCSHFRLPKYGFVEELPFDSLKMGDVLVTDQGHIAVATGIDPNDNNVVNVIEAAPTYVGNGEFNSSTLRRVMANTYTRNQNGIVKRGHNDAPNLPEYVFRRFSAPILKEGRQS